MASPRDDAIALHRAFKGFGCDTAAVVQILAYRNASQRALIQQEYRHMYSDDLNKKISSELSGDVKKAVTLWMYDPATRDATVVRQSFVNGDLRAATEVICSRTSTQIQHFKQIYLSLYKTYLEHDIEKYATGDHEKLLLAYVRQVRYEGPEADRMIAESDAKALYRAGEKKMGTDEKMFISIFSERSKAHLAAVSYAYKHVYENSLEKAVKSETSGLFEFGLLTILRCAENSGKYFAKVLHRSMKGIGTDETTLTRVIVTRAEMDILDIKTEYHKKYGKSLHDAVKKEASGHYEKFLLALIG